jgi:3-oxoadipate enol-lactonase
VLPTFTTLGAGPMLLMLHGAEGGHRAFAPQVETFANAGFRAVAWDMPGYGHSPPIEPYGWKGLAESCIRLLEALLAGDSRRRPPVLLGQGMGALLAREVVARRPELVGRLVLCASADAEDAATSRRQREALAQQRLGELDALGDMAALAEHWLPGAVGPVALPEGVQLAAHCMAGVNAATYRRALQALPFFDRHEALARIDVPTLVIGGEHDATAPPAALAQMAARIPSATHVRMEGVGHLPNLEAPDAFDQIVLNFLRLPQVLH